MPWGPYVGGSAMQNRLSSWANAFTPLGHRGPQDPPVPHDLVHVHGVDMPYPDPGDEPYDRRDIVRLAVDGQDNYTVHLNHPDDFDPDPPAFDPENPDPPDPPPSDSAT